MFFPGFPHVFPTSSGNRPVVDLLLMQGVPATLRAAHAAEQGKAGKHSAEMAKAGWKGGDCNHVYHIYI